MARKKLDAEKLEQLKKMVLEGITPEDISKQFNIAISSVHNYKRTLRDLGVDIPDVRGKRPSKTPIESDEPVTMFMQPKTSAGIKDDYIYLRVNNVDVRVHKSAKAITISDNNLFIEI